MKLPDNARIGRLRRWVLWALERAWCKVAGPEGKGWDDGYRSGHADGRGEGFKAGQRAGFTFARNMAVKAMQMWTQEMDPQAAVGRRNFQRAAEKLNVMTERGDFPLFYDKKGGSK